MSAPWTSHIPATCKVNWLKQGSVDHMGGAPPICIVPVLTSKAKKKTNATLKISNGVKQEIMKFAGRSCEESLRRVQLFSSLEHKFQIRSKISNTKKVKKAQEEALGLINDNNSNVPDNHDAFKQRIMECEEIIKSYLQDLWSLFKQLLYSPLVPDWNKIIK